MNWILLFTAGLFEVAWAVGMKKSQGFTDVGWSIFTIVCLAISMILLALAAKTLPLGTAYAVWTGIGAIGAVVLGMALFNEPRDLIRIACLLMIVGGILGLKFLAPQ